MTKDDGHQIMSICSCLSIFCSITKKKKKTRKPRPLQTRRRQRVARQQRKRRENGNRENIYELEVETLKPEYGDLQKSLELENYTKDKYCEMWRKSEGEKSKFNTSRRVLSGAVFSRELTAKPKRELMQIDNILLEDYRENNELGIKECLVGFS